MGTGGVENLEAACRDYERLADMVNEDRQRLVTGERYACRTFPRSTILYENILPPASTQVPWCRVLLHDAAAEFYRLACDYLSAVPLSMLLFDEPWVIFHSNRSCMHAAVDFTHSWASCRRLRYFTPVHEKQAGTPWQWMT